MAMQGTENALPTKEKSPSVKMGTGSDTNPHERPCAASVQTTRQRHQSTSSSSGLPCIHTACSQARQSGAMRSSGAFAVRRSTQHCMWCNDKVFPAKFSNEEVSMPHAALYVVQRKPGGSAHSAFDVSMPHAALYVVQLGMILSGAAPVWVSMPHAALYVVQLRRSQPLSRAGREGILESRRFFVPFFPYRAAFSPKNHGVDRRVPLCGAELRPNGKWRR